MIRKALACFLAVGAVGAVSVGCSDPIPPPAAGALVYNLQNSLTSARQPGESSCAKTAGKAFSWGSVDAGTSSRVNDGTEGTKVECTVKPVDGGRYEVRASLSSDGQNITFSGKIDPNSDSTFSSISVFSRYLESTLVGGEGDCTVTVVPGSDGELLGIRPGYIWAKFRCPRLVDNLSANKNVCSIRDANDATGWGGYFTFENCKT